MVDLGSWLFTSQYHFFVLHIICYGGLGSRHVNSKAYSLPPYLAVLYRDSHICIFVQSEILTMQNLTMIPQFIVFENAIVPRR